MIVPNTAVRREMGVGFWGCCAAGARLMGRVARRPIDARRGRTEHRELRSRGVICQGTHRPFFMAGGGFAANRIIRVTVRG